MGSSNEGVGVCGCCCTGTGEAQRLWGAGTEGQQAVVGVLVSGGTVTSAGGVYSFTSKVSGPHQCHHLGSDVLLKTRAGA